MSAMMSLTCLFSMAPLWELSAFRRLHTARLIRLVLCSALCGARGARMMPPHVHPGWKVRTLRTECSGLLEKTCLHCSACLTLGQELWRGGERGQEYVRVKRARGEERLVQLRKKSEKWPHKPWLIWHLQSKKAFILVAHYYWQIQMVKLQNPQHDHTNLNHDGIAYILLVICSLLQKVRLEVCRSLTIKTISASCPCQDWPMHLNQKENVIYLVKSYSALKLCWQTATCFHN